MSEYLIQDTTLTGIADAIREKTGGTEPVSVSDMAAQIEGIQAGGGDIDALIDKSITEISSNATNIPSGIFRDCLRLVSGDFPKATNFATSSFQGCSGLTNITAPLLTDIGMNAFYGCSALKSVDIPIVRNIGSWCFYGCSALESIDTPLLLEIKDRAFYDCSMLKTVILRNSDVVKLATEAAFGRTPIASGTGYIYVPSALIEQYKVATNWSTYAAQFRALEDYTVDGTTTGELDPTKTGA